MSECTLIRERMPLLLTESLEGEEREGTYLHIEGCEPCGTEWRGMRETWTMLTSDRDRTVPDRLRSRFLDALGEQATPATPDNVVSFWQRPATRWIAQAAAVVTLVGGSYFAGTRTLDVRPAASPTSTVAQAPSQFTLAANRIVPAAQLAPQIEGTPEISNIRFIENPQGSSGEVGVSFDLTTNVTVTGSPQEKSFVSLMAYLLQDRRNPAPSQSDAIRWVRQTYGGSESSADPVIVGALANVLQSDSNEGVRLGAIETLRTIRANDVAGGDKVRDALIEALKNDPNPAIRIKAVEALTNMMSGEGSFDPLTVDTLREKASQADENPYVRIKAAEALSQLSL